MPQIDIHCFGADWCNACTKLQPQLDSLASCNSDLNIIYHDIDNKGGGREGADKLEEAKKKFAEDLKTIPYVRIVHDNRIYDKVQNMADIKLKLTQIYQYMP